MLGRFATLLFAGALVACAGADRRPDPPMKSSGGAGPGVTSAPPAEPDAFDVPSTGSNTRSNPARRSSYGALAEYRVLAEARAGLLSNPLLGEGGNVGLGGSSFAGSGFGGAPGPNAGRPSVSGGSSARGSSASSD